MRVVWLTETFGDYRVPVFAELDKLLGGELRVVYSSARTHPRCVCKIESVLGSRAIGLVGERTLLRLGQAHSGFSNRAIDIAFPKGLFSTVAKCSPDVLIGQGFARLTVAALFSRLIHGTPLVVSYQRTHHTQRAAQWYRTAYRRLVLRLVDVMCCNGRLSQEYSQWLGMPSDRILTGVNVADTSGLVRLRSAITAEDRQAIRSRLNASGTVFLFVGRLVELKGVRHLLEGFIALHRGGAAPPATLVIVGDGPEHPLLTAMSEASGLGNVRFTGTVDHDNIAEYYAAADVFAIPTLEDNWSIVVPEAMSCGLPIMCSKYNGCWPELVRDGVNGFTFDPRNTQEVAARFSYFLHHNESIPLMGGASKQIVADHSPKRAARILLKACRMAASRRKKGSETSG